MRRGPGQNNLLGATLMGDKHTKSICQMHSPLCGEPGVENPFSTVNPTCRALVCTLLAGMRHPPRSRMEVHDAVL